MELNTKTTIPLAPLDRARLARLKAEWELAALRAELARAALDHAARTVAEGLGAGPDVEFDFHAGVIRARFEMATVDGDPNVLVRINNTNSGTGSTFIVRDQFAVANMLKLEADSKLATFYGDAERAAPFVIDNVDGGVSTSILQLRRGGTNRLDLAAVAASTFAEVRASTGGWDLRLTGDEVHVNTPNSTGTVALFSTNGTPRLGISWDGTTVTLGTAHAMLAEAQTDVTIHFGKSTATTSTFVLKRTTSGGAQNSVVEVRESGLFEWRDGDVGALEARLYPADANDDCFLDLGIEDTTRGKLRLNRDSLGTTRPGVLVFQDQDGNDHYLWVYDTNTGSEPYELRASTTDPGAGTGGTTIAKWA